MVAALVGREVTGTGKSSSSGGSSSGSKKKKKKRLKGDGALSLGVGLTEEDQLLGLMDVMSASIKGVSAAAASAFVRVGGGLICWTGRLIDTSIHTR